MDGKRFRNMFSLDDETREMLYPESKDKLRKAIVATVQKKLDSFGAQGYLIMTAVRALRLSKSPRKRTLSGGTFTEILLQRFELIRKNVPRERWAEALNLSVRIADGFKPDEIKWDRAKFNGAKESKVF